MSSWLEYWTRAGLYYEKKVEKWVRLDQSGFTELSFVQTVLRRLVDFEQWCGGRGGDKSVYGAMASKSQIALQQESCMNLPF